MGRPIGGDLSKWVVLPLKEAASWLQKATVFYRMISTLRVLYIRCTQTEIPCLRKARLKAKHLARANYST